MEILPEAADSFLSPQLNGRDVCVKELLKNESHYNCFATFLDYYLFLFYKILKPILGMHAQIQYGKTLHGNLHPRNCSEYPENAFH